MSAELGLRRDDRNRNDVLMTVTPTRFTPLLTEFDTVIKYSTKICATYESRWLELIVRVHQRQQILQPTSMPCIRSNRLAITAVVVRSTNDRGCVPKKVSGRSPIVFQSRERSSVADCYFALSDNACVTYWWTASVVMGFVFLHIPWKNTSV